MREVIGLAGFHGVFIKALMLMVLSTGMVQAATWQITYPRPLTEFDRRSSYPIRLLSLALDQTGVKYNLTASDRILLQSKALTMLADNREINVAWSMTDTNREALLLPIRIPIFKGLIGWRIFLVRDDSRGRFAAVSQLDQLRQFKTIQGHDWPDTKILQANGFDVATSKEYPALFSMLEQSRGDLFPRSVVEIWSELSSDHMPANVNVETGLGIRYPTAMYFFVNKRNATLGRLIENGLEKAIANGSFDELFMQVHAGAINRAKMRERQFFELSNPLLPEQTPINRPELWYQPDADE